jgi:hypothetical protein
MSGNCNIVQSLGINEYEKMHKINMEKFGLSINTSCDQPGKEIPVLSMTLSAKRMQLNCECRFLLPQRG